MQYLGKLENFTAVTTIQATEKGKLDSDAAIALAKYLIEGRGSRRPASWSRCSSRCRPTGEGGVRPAASCAS